MRQAPAYSVSYFALFTVYGVASPYLQILLRNLGYGPAAIGLYLSLFEIVGILGPLAVARAADAARRRKGALAFSAGLVLVSLPGLAFRLPAWVTALALAVFALGLKSLVPVMDSEGMAFAQASGRKSAYGRLRVMGSMGFMTAALGLQALPAFAGGPPWVIALALAATAVFFLCTLPFLGRPGAEGSRTPAAGSDAPGHEAGAAAAAPHAAAARRFDPVFALGLVIIALGRFAIAPISSFISIWASEELHFASVGAVWAIAAAAEIPLMLLASSIIPRTGAMGAIAVSSAALVVRLAIYAFFPSAAGLVARTAPPLPLLRPLPARGRGLRGRAGPARTPRHGHGRLHGTRRGPPRRPRLRPRRLRDRGGRLSAPLPLLHRLCARVPRPLCGHAQAILRPLARLRRPAQWMQKEATPRGGLLAHCGFRAQ